MLDLESRIRENKAFFEDNEPDNGHRERFINKLSESGSKKRKISLSSISKIAASLIILISASYFIVNETRQAKSNVMYITQIELTDEMVQLQSYCKT